MGLIGGFVGRGRGEWSGGERRGGIECLLSSVVELKLWYTSRPFASS